MEYLKVYWIHNFDDEPILFYSEIDDDRNETRKVEIYRDKSFGLASIDIEFGGTALGEIPVPNIEEIREDAEFDPYYITQEEFDSVWLECMGYLSNT